ncbi:MAG TPA: RidA family protein [Candidatus Binataceae bacterium]|nr:RidA family protein [Candidatus Binataceae bacterium]
MSETVKYSNPTGVSKPLGAYSHVSRVKTSELLFIAGQLAVNEAGELVGKGDFAAQMRQVFDNLGRVLKAEGLGFDHVVKFTTFLVHSQDIENFMAVRKELFPSIYPGGKYPPNTLLMIDRLVGEQFLIEVEAIAAI